VCDDIPDEMKLADAVGRCGGVQRRMTCPRCGLGFIAGRGHLGSDYCLIHRTTTRLAKSGYAPLADVRAHIAGPGDLPRRLLREGRGDVVTMKARLLAVWDGGRYAERLERDHLVEYLRRS